MPNGKEEVRTNYFYGYKTHVSMNAESNLITGLEVSSGNAWDGKHFTSLVDMDMKQDLHSAIMLKDNRLKKKNSKKQVWQEMVRREDYQQGRRERYKIERKFGEAKAYLTAIALNLKRMVKLISGVGFNCPSYGTC